MDFQLGRLNCLESSVPSVPSVVFFRAVHQTIVMFFPVSWVPDEKFH
jgi:hypothetical protein